MELINVIVAAVAAYAFGAVWYMSLSKQWITASGVACDANGKPANKSVTPFILSADRDAGCRWHDAAHVWDGRHRHRG